MGHVYPQNLVVTIRKRPPYFGNNTLIGHDLAGILGQQGNQLIFDLGQMDILSLYLYQPAFKVNEKIAYFIFKTLGAGRSLAVAQRGADAGQQLSRAKGFGEVVVCSQVQGSHLAALQGPGGNHDDGQGAGGSDLLYEFQAVHVRQSQVQKYHIWLKGFDELQPVRSGVGAGNLVALGGQDSLYEVTDVLLVFNDDDVGFGIHDLVFPPIW